MSDDALRQLEAVRARRVDDARVALMRAERAQRMQVERRRAAQAEELAVLRAVAETRAAFAWAADVAALRAAEAGLHALQWRARELAERVRAAQAGEDEADRAVAQARDALRESELARRVIQRGLEQRAADVSLRTERRLEDERDDQFRGRPPRA